ncbi:hypothetical protein TWF696_007118 [Orbilia brochopaga]|uniref:Uncharacterized protein n=1 Tax=Orbilia brochopaga TaxID=3140254 RepID=A0AAV9UU97_9PEZI
MYVMHIAPAARHSSDGGFREGQAARGYSLRAGVHGPGGRGALVAALPDWPAGHHHPHRRREEMHDDGFRLERREGGGVSKPANAHAHLHADQQKTPHSR